MRGAGLVVAAALSLTAPAAARDTLVELTVEGRPIDRHSGAAVLHHGLFYADAIDLTKCFDGFITLLGGGAATITVGTNTGTFTPGRSQATVNAETIALPDAPFRRNGDLFVPLDAFATSVAGVNVRHASARRADIRIGPDRHP